MPQLPPFQQWFIELFSILNDVLVGLAAVFGIMGLWAWRAEHIGKTKYDIAKEIGTLACKYRDLYKDARLKGRYAYEHADRKRDGNETDREREIRDEFYARWKRLQSPLEIIQKLQALSWLAETVLGEEDAKLIEPLEKSFKELQFAVHDYFDQQIQMEKNPQRGGSTPLDREQENIIYGRPDDDLSRNVDLAVDNLKRRLKRYLV